MRTACTLAAAALLAWAAPAFAGPDFVTADRTQPLAASDGRRVQQPLDDIVFALDDAALLPSAQAQIASAARWLAVHPGYRLVVQGHADSSGTAAYNADLAARRSLIVRNHAIDCGVDPDLVVIAVYGENGARRQPDELDRRVVIFATAEPLSRVVSAELDHDAIEAVWTRGTTQFRETRGITPVGAITPRG
jgi:outer membrane protein OmpA-like peptidoglycan-associated protein